jgi:hypothetical protein
MISDHMAIMPLEGDLARVTMAGSSADAPSSLASTALEAHREC